LKITEADAKAKVVAKDESIFGPLLALPAL
jgi:hypothetical protein